MGKGVIKRKTDLLREVVGKCQAIMMYVVMSVVFKSPT